MAPNVQKNHASAFASHLFSVADAQYSFFCCVCVCVWLYGLGSRTHLGVEPRNSGVVVIVVESG